jgi:hypothetical protein
VENGSKRPRGIGGIVSAVFSTPGVAVFVVVVIVFVGKITKETSKSGGGRERDRDTVVVVLTPPKIVLTKKPAPPGVAEALAYFFVFVFCDTEGCLHHCSFVVYSTEDTS